MDFFGFGYLKQKVFKRRASTLGGLWKVLNQEWNLVTPETCRKVFENWKFRLRLVRAMSGEHIENTQAIHNRRRQ